MAYLGHQPVSGEDNSFKVLDDITSYTLSFDATSPSVVSVSDNTITQNNHRFITGQRVTYTHGGGTAIGGLTSGGIYYIIKEDQNTIKLASSAANATNNVAESFSGLGLGSSHTINVSFDGVNTKFKATHDNGTKAKITRAVQLTISMNGVIQQPQDSTTPTNGFGIDLDSVIVFSTAPVISDVFWGNLLASNFPTFDITDNKVDNFTGDGTTVDFTLSKIAVNNENVLVTLDGVIQYPSDATTVRAYTVQENVLTFSGPPGLGVDIQVRHIGFAGASIGSGSGGVTGFYGRTGNVVLNDGDVLRGDGALITNLQAGKFLEDTVGIHTVSSVGVNTNTLENTTLTGVGNSFQGMYISNGMMILDNTLNGEHYIGTAFNGLMAGPVTINGVLSVDGNYVVV